MAKKRRNLAQEIEAARSWEQMCEKLLEHGNVLNVLYKRIKPLYDAINELNETYKSELSRVQQQAIRARIKIAALLREQKEGGGVDG